MLEAEYPAWVTFVGEQALFGNVLVGALHLWLMRDRYRTASPGKRLSFRCCSA